MRLSFNLLLLNTLLILAHISSAQLSLSVKIGNCSYSTSAEVVLPFGDPILIGSINENGQVHIHLTEKHGEEIQLMLEEEGQSDSQIKRSIPTVAEQFICGRDALTVVNGTTKIYKANFDGALYVVYLSDKQLIGKIRLSSSEQFSDTYYNYNMLRRNLKPGYIIDFYYVESDASVIGTCEQVSYTIDMERKFIQTYDYHIKLKKGWNLVKTEIKDVYTDLEGNKQPLHVVQTTISEVPETANFHFTKTK